MTKVLGIGGLRFSVSLALLAGTMAASAFLTTVMAVGEVEAQISANVAQPDTPRADYGLKTRTPWTTSRITGSPDPPPPYRVERVVPRLRFRNPTVITNAPGTDRLFVAEQYGKIYSFPNTPDCEQPDLFLDVPQDVLDRDGRDRDIGEFEAIYGLTFHPEFAQNRLCYVCYVVRGKDSGEQFAHGTRVSSFRVLGTDPPRCDPDSEQILITWLQGGHNGGCLKFSPKDGYLYISTGDGGSAFPPDGLNAGQDLSNLLSAILRIDVDRAGDGGRPYAVPSDNPFVGLEGARPEIWAYGLRNPWKMSFDRETGDLWTGDVGWELWELVYYVKRAGNYGWSIMEGRQPVHVERTRGPTPIIEPTLEIAHIDGASVTGGFVYRGKKLPELVGQYIFGDWETRRVWSARFDGEKLVDRRDLTEPTVRLVAFGEDNDGELFLLDYDTGTIHELVPNEMRDTAQQFPRRLSQTGLFESAALHEPAPGVVPFSINAAQWADHAMGQRLIGVPGGASIVVHDAAEEVPGSMFRRKMDFPTDSVLAKTLWLESKRDDPESRRRIETQILHFNGTAWRGYTYEWDDDQQDAVLVDASGKDKTIEVADPHAPGGARQQTWRFPSRAECGRCHNPWAEHTLAFNLPQLNKDHDYDGVVADQLSTLRHIGIFESQGNAPAGQNRRRGERRSGDGPDELTRLANPYDTSEDLNARARSYLHVNCAHCHRFNGGGVAYFQLQQDVALDETQAIGTRPTQGTFGIHDARIIAPGAPFQSVLFYRMAKCGSGRMPYLGSEVVDSAGLRMMHDWIRQLPGPTTDVASDDDVDFSAFSTSDEGERTKTIDDWLASTGSALRLFYGLLDNKLPKPLSQATIEAAAAHAEVPVRDLFEQLLPEAQRSKRLGSVIRPEEILTLAGDACRGHQLFHDTAGVQCKNCHKINDDGKTLGPDLSKIGSKLRRAELLESMLDPSKNVDPQFATYLLETGDGRVHTGLLVRRTEEEVVLQDSQQNEIHVPAQEVERFLSQRQSLMPELLLRDMTADQVADLLEYLQTLR